MQSFHMQQARCAAGLHQTVHCPQLSHTRACTRRLSKVVTQAGLFGLNFGRAGGTDVKGRKQEVQHQCNQSRGARPLFGVWSMVISQ